MKESYGEKGGLRNRGAPEIPEVGMGRETFSLISRRSRSWAAEGDVGGDGESSEAEKAGRKL